MGTPLALWVCGSASLTEITRTAVTVTGTRAATGYGETVAADLAGHLARSGVTIVSGGALGIDARAHHAALTNQGRTMAVLACGVDQTYPSYHAHLFADILDHGGLLISEYPIGAFPTRTRFAARCRLLAALSAATVIVEAGRHSTILATATAAQVLGRRLYGVPGPITSAHSAGVNELLHTGEAIAISSPEHIRHIDQRGSAR